LEGWRKEYNEIRNHSSLGYQTPNEFATFGKPPFRAAPSTPASRKNQITLPNNRNQRLAESTV
jgi:hypothetical protein